MDMDIEVPSLGESIKKAVLASWLKPDGATVAEGDDLFELETEKAMVVFPSPAAGTMTIAVAAGQEVKIGQKVAVLKTGEAQQAPERAAKPVKPAEAAAAGGPALSPAVRRIVAEKGLDASQIPGTGKCGRLSKEDALKAAGEVAVKAPPPAPAAAEAAPTPPTAGIDPASDGRPRKRVPMTLIRKRTAERLVRAKQNAAYLTTFNEVDMLKVTQIRSQRRDDFEKEHGIRIGFMSFFVKAACQALKQFPVINCVIDGDDVLYQQFYDIGIAVSLETGLIVPVIRDADHLSFAGIENAIASLAKRAREKKLLPEELSGGTFTITNGGVFGSLLSTPIPAYPQTAILGMHTIKQRPVVVDDQIVARPMMYVALTYDHRVVDGRDAIGFLCRIKEFIEEPDKLLLEM